MNDSMNKVEPNMSFSPLLEHAANNDVNRFKQLLAHGSLSINEVGTWYVPQRSFKRMSKEHRTPLMIAATYGCIDVLKFILSSSQSDVNRTCGSDKTTALHCAASSGTPNAYEVIKLLLDAGANTEIVDGNGSRPVDALIVPQNHPGLKKDLEKLLNRGDDSDWAALHSEIDSVLNASNENHEYVVDPILPNSVPNPYDDNFVMFEYKVHPCPQPYSRHDWRKCPFFHPDERERRRDLRKISYYSTECNHFKNGRCNYGELCQYSHGEYESNLHPTRYRTQICKYGALCRRHVCFFAHTPQQRRQAP